MQYYFNKILNAGFTEAVTTVKNALQTEGFGIVSEIDFQSKIKEKLNIDIHKYLILGACNPAYAYKAMQAEEKIGVMLPCNVIIIDRENGTTEIAAVDPMASMMAIPNEELSTIALEVTEKLKKVVNSL
jgi:uncharacterized protein (DUF302 family)